MPAFAEKTDKKIVVQPVVYLIFIKIFIILLALTKSKRSCLMEKMCQSGRIWLHGVCPADTGKVYHRGHNTLKSHRGKSTARFLYSM